MRSGLGDHLTGCGIPKTVSVNDLLSFDGNAKLT